MGGAKHPVVVVFGHCECVLRLSNFLLCYSVKYKMLSITPTLYPLCPRRHLPVGFSIRRIMAAVLALLLLLEAAFTPLHYDYRLILFQLKVLVEAHVLFLLHASDHILLCASDD